MQHRGALCHSSGPCACTSKGCALPPPSQPHLQLQHPCLAAPVLLSQPWWWEAGKLLQPRCSVLAWTGAVASSSSGFHMARHRCSLGCWEIPAGLRDGWDHERRPLRSRFIDLFFFLCSSYLHCKWATLEELEKDPRISQKIKRFRNKQAQMKHIFTEVRAERGKQLCPTPAHLSSVRWLSRPGAERCCWHLPAQARPAPGPKFRAGIGQTAVPALPELCRSSAIPGCCPEPSLGSLTDTVAMPRQQHGISSF